MKIKFLGVPGEPDIFEINMYGYAFKKGGVVDVPDSDKLAQMKLSNHPHFSGGTMPLQHLVLPQTIPVVERTHVTSDGVSKVSQIEVDAINADPRMPPGMRVTTEEVLIQKEAENGDDQRVGPTGPEEAGSPGVGSGRKRGRPRAS